jgi:hypothetical protein
VNTVNGVNGHEHFTISNTYLLHLMVYPVQPKYLFDFYPASINLKSAFIC